MTPVSPTLERERELLSAAPFVIGLDEVGRGALAGPVAVGAALIDASGLAAGVPDGLRDSKLISEPRRPAAAERAAAWARASAVGWSSADEIDEVGILPALGRAAVSAIRAIAAQGFDVSAGIVLLDGNHDYITPVAGPGLDVRTVVKGDRDCASLSAASVIAKVARDAVMAGLHDEHPAYAWDRNKGYASSVHRAAIRANGLTAHHRSSWAISDAPALF